jgi:ABC-type multidrug transport system fused ATPase/permease subunit
MRKVNYHSNATQILWTIIRKNIYYNIDIKDFDIRYLRSQFGVVGQEPTVFTGTFRDNIRYNSLTASEEEIREAARLANAMPFIEGR